MVKKTNWTIEEDIRLIELFKAGYQSREIGRKLNRTKDAVQKRIQRLKRKNEISEKERLIKQQENREIIKAINYENNKCLSNHGTIKASLSAYKNNNMGDLVLDVGKSKEQGFTYSWDMPKRKINDEARSYNKTFKY